MNKAADLYDLLGVRRSANLGEIRRAYQKLARRLHPDLNPGDAAAAERFQAVSRAFEVLQDAQRRAQYDRGEMPPPAPRPVPEVGFEGFDFSPEVQASVAGFREIFAGVLRPEREDRTQSRGEDLEQPARISFEECFHGTRRRVHVMRRDLCRACGGRGEVALGSRACPSCRGTGQVRAARGRMIFTRACPDCDATGVVAHHPCSRCAGEGRVMQSEWVEVQIPPGVADGTRLRVPGWGNAGRRGGPPGDFVLVVQVEAHPLYRRQGADLFCDVPVTITEAALGAHVEIPTPDGPVNIQIPAGTQGGQRFRLRKRGLPRTAGPGRGDLWVEVRVWVPTVEDDASRHLLEEFARRNPKSPRAAQPTPRAAAAKG